MLGNGRLFKRESVNDLAYGALFKGEEGQDIAAAGFGDGVESVRGGGSARHGANIYPYRNMSRTILGRDWRRFWPVLKAVPGGRKSGVKPACGKQAAALPSGSR